MLSKLTLSALAAAVLSFGVVGCSDEPSSAPAPETSSAPSTEQNSDMMAAESMSADSMSAESMSAESTDTSSVEVTGEGPETDGVIVSDDLMVEKGYAQANQ